MTTSQPAAGGADGAADGGFEVLAGAKLLLDERFDERDLVALRSAVAAHADDAGLPEARAAELVLIAHELAINAVLHGGGAGRLRLWATRSAVHCQVTDEGPGLSGARLGEPARPAAGAAGGRGLWLVRQFSDRLTLDNRAPGASVIATVRLPGRA
jgi:anti-sigma regulatory factor (Ser/Thr protein kinase)